MTSPTSRTLDLLRKSGYLAEVVERWVPRANIRKDFLGVIDLLAIRRGENGVLAVQATSAANVSARLGKARAEPRLAVWLASGNRFEVWGWAKVRDRWQVRRVAVTGEDLAPMEVAAMPRRRRAGKGERQRGLFDA